MTTFKIEIVETTCKVVEMPAETAQEAMETVQREYREGNIVLGSNDFQDYQINVL